MHLLSVFSSSVANGAVNAALAGVLDPAVTLTANNRYIYPSPHKLFASTVIGPNLTRARLNAPSLRSLFLPELYPGVVGSAVPDLGYFSRYDQNGPTFMPNEEVTVEVSRAGAGPLQCWAALWVAPKFTPAPSGPSYTLFGSAAPTLVANAWVFTSVVFDQSLPTGIYDVVGMGAALTNGLFARLVYPGVSNYRPGVMVEAAYGNRPYEPTFRFGRMGSFGRFVSTAQPGVEVMGHTPGASTLNVFLDLIKTG